MLRLGALKKMTIEYSNIKITSPKLQPKDRQGWRGFYPYYAGYSLSFVEVLIKSMQLNGTTVVLDPWNGSGTTTLASARCGLHSHGFDLNPAMLLVARARSLRAIDADSIEPILTELEHHFSKPVTWELDRSDPLQARFHPETAVSLRRMEVAIRNLLVSQTAANSLQPSEKITPLAAFFYVSLFALVRQSLTSSKTANPTWLRKPDPEHRQKTPMGELTEAYRSIITDARNALGGSLETVFEGVEPQLHCVDSSEGKFPTIKADLIISSPPYCTRLDYAAATETELAVIAPLCKINYKIIRQKMLGTVISPSSVQDVPKNWGVKCNNFLNSVKHHPSKASGGYYFRNHVDYFSKLDLSLREISKCMVLDGAAVFVVQDSFYKDVHNDLPEIFSDLAANYGLILQRREDFPVKTLMASKHKYVKNYRSEVVATEAVLCFRKEF